VARSPCHGKQCERVIHLVASRRFKDLLISGRECIPQRVRTKGAGGNGQKTECGSRRGKMSIRPNDLHPFPRLQPSFQP
jgi:hypothetical protein